MDNTSLAETCTEGRDGSHAYWYADGIRKCSQCGTPSADIPKIKVAGCELDACSPWGKEIQTQRESAGFHWRGDVYFKRMDDGSVRVRRFESFNGYPHAKCWVIPATEWASIVCSVSQLGETGERWNAARDFHGRTSENGSDNGA